MSAIRRKWGNVKNVMLPQGIVIGLNTGYSLPTDFVYFNAANGRCLCIVEDDSLPGATGDATALSGTTGAGGAHTGGSVMGITVEYAVGDTAGCPSACGDHSWDAASYGNHAHPITAGYSPKMNQLRLIQASKSTLPPIGGLMLSGSALPDHTQVNTFNSNGGILAGGASMGVVEAGAWCTVGAADLGSHEHHPGNNTRKLAAMMSGASTVVYAGGGVHSDHTTTGITMSYNCYRGTLRLFQIAHRRKIQGLYGVWPYPGCPAGWQVLYGWHGRYIELTAAGNGAFAGDNIVTFNGTTGASAHGHGQAGSGSNALVGNPQHSSLAHAHTITGGLAYHPPRYHVKLITYVG